MTLKLIPTEQHAKITGYRKLTDTEIGFMNRIKAFEAEYLELSEAVENHQNAQLFAADGEADDTELQRISRSQAHQWHGSANHDVLTGLMKLVRAIAQPECQLYLKRANEELAAAENPLPATE